LAGSQQQFLKIINNQPKKFTNMKKSILIGAILLVALVNSSFAGSTEGVYDNIHTSFKQEFKNAEILNWENYKSYSKATFRMNNKVMFAYYSDQGELIAVTRNLLPSELPIHLMMELKTHYANYWITDLFEVSETDRSFYRISLEDQDHKLVLKSDNMNYWELVKKVSKSDGQ
jgi:hypothetical protein